MRTHSGEKPFSCNQCNFSRTTASYLKIHIRTHSGGKPFRCDQCDYSATQAQHLKTHILKHTGARSFTCNQYSYSCNGSDSMIITCFHTPARCLLPANNAIPPPSGCTVTKKVLIIARDRVLIRTFLAFWVPIGSLFIFQGPYFQCFGLIHAKNVNSVCMYTAVS